MALSIQALLDPQEDPKKRPQEPDTARAQASIGAMMRNRVSAATADSIFHALGYPANPVTMSVTSIPNAAAIWEPDSNQVLFNPDWVGLIEDIDVISAAQGKSPAGEFLAQRIPGVLAHEMTHANTLNDAVEFDIQNPNVLGLFHAFFNRYDDLSMKERGQYWADYLQLPLDEASKGFRDDDTQRAEIFATNIERGYQIARQFDPNDPSKIAAETAAADEAFPGTREAVNFWVRSFLGRE